MKDNKLFTLVLPVLAGLMVIVTIIVFVFGDEKNKNNTREKTSLENELKEDKPGWNYDTVFTGVITDIDSQTNEIVIYSIKYESNMILTYSGATDVQNKHGKVIAMSQMKIGQIVEAGYQRESMKLVMLHESKDAWEYKNLTNFEFRESGNVLHINEDRFQFTKDINITMDGIVLDKSKILKGDEITARGIGNTIWSIQVTKGHGGIKFKNYVDLIGGKVIVGGYDAVDIEEDMRLTVAEGTYNVWFVNGELRGEKKVTVKRNETVTMNLEDIYLEPSDTALVNFNIEPGDAILYVDDNMKSHNKPLELEYGEYEVYVEANGYKPYKGKIKVDEAALSVTIKLTEQEIETQEPEETQEPGTTQSPDASQIPGTTQVPSGTQVPGTTQTPGASQAPGITQAPGSQVPSETQSSGATQTPLVVPTPGTPQVPDIPQIPNVPQIQVPNTTQTPDATQSPSMFADGSGGVG